jgi:hypothetical protein
MEKKGVFVIVYDGPAKSQGSEEVGKMLFEYAENTGRRGKIVNSLAEIEALDGETSIIFVSHLSWENAVAAKREHPVNKIFILTGTGIFDGQDLVRSSGIEIIRKCAATKGESFVTRIFGD